MTNIRFNVFPTAAKLVNGNKAMALFILLSILLCGCSLEKEQGLFASWGKTNQQQNLALGKRTYTKDFDLIFPAIITGLADKGFTIKNMERQSGYILAEGYSPVPLTTEQRFGEEMVKEISHVSPRKWKVIPGNGKYSITVLVRRLNKKAQVKMRISLASVAGAATTVYSSIYPPLYAEMYKESWQAVERQIFMDQHLDPKKAK